MNDRQEAAHRYLESRLPITLCCGKSVKYDDWQNRVWTPQTINRAFRANPDLNVGVILGPRSGWIDFDADGPGADRELLELFGDDLPIMPTFSSSRGYHRIAKYSKRLESVGKASVKFGDLEVRIGANGKAVQSLFPPSKTDGFTRAWKVSLEDCDAPKLPKKVIDRLIKAGGGAEQRVTQRTQIACVTVSTVLPPADAIELAIQRTIPSESGFRHRRLFNFARELKGIVTLADADLSALKPIVRQWYERALPKIGTHDFEESWYDFVNAWDNVRHPVGQEKIRMIYEASLSKLPAAAAHYQADSIRRLVGLCHELQKTAGDKPFYLDCRTAGALIGINHVLANKYLNLLVRERVLELVVRGQRNRASEYRYIAGE